MSTVRSASRTVPAHDALPPLTAPSPWGQALSMAPDSGSSVQSHQLSYSGCPAASVHFIPWCPPQVCVTAAYAIHLTKRLRLWILNSLGTFNSQASWVSDDCFTLQLDCSFLLPMDLQCPSPWSSHLSSPPGLSPWMTPSLLLSSKASVRGTQLAQPHTHRLPFPEHLHPAPLSIHLHSLLSCALIAFCF